MTGRLATWWCIAMAAWCAAFVGLVVVPAARADTVATCTTDSQTSYCEQLPTGTNSDASSSGFVIAEATMGVLISMTTGVILLRKLFALAGWGSW